MVVVRSLHSTPAQTAIAAASGAGATNTTPLISWAGRTLRLVWQTRLSEVDNLRHHPLFFCLRIDSDERTTYFVSFSYLRIDSGWPRA